MYRDEEAAHQEFADMFGASPDFVQSVVPSDLPTSYRMWTSVERASRATAAAMDHPAARQALRAPR